MNISNNYSEYEKGEQNDLIKLFKTNLQQKLKNM